MGTLPNATPTGQPSMWPPASTTIGLAGDGAALVAGQEQGEVGDVLGGGDVAQRHAGEETGALGLVVDALLGGRAPYPVLPQLGVDPPGTMQLHRMP